MIFAIAIDVNERTIEIKVGVFVLAAAAILVGFVIAIGELSFKRTWPINVEYGFSGSIHPGAPVRLSGVQIGRVASVDLMEEERRDSLGRPLMVTLKLDLEDRVRGIVREDTRFHIGTAGVLGEAYIDVDTGRMQGSPLEAGSTIRGVDPPRTDLLLSRASLLIENLTEAIDGDGESIGELLASLSRLAAAAEDLLAENGDDLAAILENVTSASGDLAAAAGSARSQLEGGDLANLISDASVAMATLRSEVPALLSSVGVAVERLESASEVLAKIDSKDLTRLRKTLARYEATGVQAESLLEDIHRVVERIDEGEGTLGAMINDGQVYDDLRELISDIRRHPWKLLRRR